jgi:hypothetical protein
MHVDNKAIDAVKNMQRIPLRVRICTAHQNRHVESTRNHLVRFVLSGDRVGRPNATAKNRHLDPRRIVGWRLCHPTPTHEVAAVPEVGYR